MHKVDYVCRCLMWCFVNYWCSLERILGWANSILVIYSSYGVILNYKDRLGTSSTVLLILYNVLCLKHEFLLGCCDIGISLTAEQWSNFSKNVPAIEKAIKKTSARMYLVFNVVGGGTSSGLGRMVTRLIKCIHRK